MTSASTKRHLKADSPQPASKLPGGNAPRLSRSTYCPPFLKAAVRSGRLFAAKNGGERNGRFRTLEVAHPHIPSVWAIVESHRIPMRGAREGYPSPHVFKSLKPQAELVSICRMLGA